MSDCEEADSWDAEIIVKRSADRVVTPVLTAALQDGRLSYAARGMLAEVLATSGTVDIPDDAPELAELIRYGYCRDGVITDNPKMPL